MYDPRINSSGLRLSAPRLRPAVRSRRGLTGIPSDFQRFTRQQLYEVIENARVAIGVRGLHGEWLAFNNRMCSMFGYTPDEFRAITTVELTPQGERAAAIEFNRLMAAGKLWSYKREKTYLHKSGHLLHCLLSVTVIPSPEGKPDHLISVIEDLSEINEARQALKASRDTLEAEVQERTLALTKALDAANEANEAKRNILANTSHEMKTPLNAIIGFSDIITNVDSLAPEKIKEYASAIHAAGRRILQVLDDILEIARHIVSSRSTSPEEFDLVALVRSRVEIMLRVHSDKAVTWAPLSVPDRACPVYLDQSAMTRAIDSILDNAIKFSPQRGQIDVSVLDSGPNEIVVVISDRGVGIPPCQLERVFEPFFQVDAGLSRRYEGCGLGLTIAKVMIEAIGGRVSIASSTDVGTRVTISVPKRQRSVAEDASKDRGAQP